MTTKTLKLTFKERAMLPEILPAAANKLKQIIVRSLIRKVEFTPEEIEKFEIRILREEIRWNQQAASETFELELSDSEVIVLKEASSDLDKNNRVTQHNLSLIEKIDSL
ncbi:MAG: hypothetical protein FD166_1474 [Bacteroidetes bacterium]|nr:MAG: hypothetical protein FD166_1474 [Bacteroidota bacterium]